MKAKQQAPSEKNHKDKIPNGRSKGEIIEHIASTAKGNVAVQETSKKEKRKSAFENRGKRRLENTPGNIQGQMDVESETHNVRHNSKSTERTSERQRMSREKNTHAKHKENGFSNGTLPGQVKTLPGSEDLDKPATKSQVILKVLRF